MATIIIYIIYSDNIVWILNTLMHALNHV